MKKYLPTLRETIWILAITLVALLLIFAIPVHGQTVPVPQEPVSVKQSGPVSLTVPVAAWVAYLSFISLGVTLLGLLAKVLLRASKLVTEVHEYHSVIVQIAKEFKSDSGSTLKDAINRIEKATTENQVAAAFNKSMTENLTNLLLKLNTKKSE